MVMSLSDMLELIEEKLYMWLMDVHAGDRADYVIGDMFIYEIIDKYFPDLWKEHEKMKESPPMRVLYFGSE